MNLNQLTVILLLFSFVACKDAEIDQAMDEYCTCIDKYKSDPEGRLECIDFMNDLQEKYKNQPRKLNLIIEKTNDCW